VLLEAGADVHQLGCLDTSADIYNNCWNPLSLNGHDEVARALLEAGADVRSSVEVVIRQPKCMCERTRQFVNVKSKSKAK